MSSLPGWSIGDRCPEENAENAACQEQGHKRQVGFVDSACKQSITQPLLERAKERLPSFAEYAKEGPA